ncbi:MAG: TPM domain-containing protein [Neisseria sp.]|nr:TPM domain-containing protein [Neisseria sp.]
MQEKNKFKRLWQHWLHPRWRVERYFPTADLQRISRDIGVSEQNHKGQIRFVIESRYSSEAVLNGLDTRTRAWQWFGELGVWDTERNSGVLVYVSFADHAVEIVADRGISAKVGEEEWRHVCQTMLDDFKREAFVAGLERGLQEVGGILTAHFPRKEAAAFDELPNDVILR